MIPARILLILGLFFCACAPNKHPQKTEGDPMVAPEEILQSSMSFLYYRRDVMKLTVPYTALDSALKPITKEAMLQAFATGHYLPLRIFRADSSVQYKLYPVPASTKPELTGIIQQIGTEYYQHFLKEGKPFPFITFKDVNGEVYTKESTQGKVLAIKCWFIHCHSCVKEIPALNQVVQQYNQRKDVLFLSLAFDEADDLRRFLKQTMFRYAVIPVPLTYLTEQVGANAYPTHIIVDKEGIIRSVSNTEAEMTDALAVVAGK